MLVHSITHRTHLTGFAAAMRFTITHAALELTPSPHTPVDISTYSVIDTVMSEYTADLERGDSLPLDELRRGTTSETQEAPSDPSSRGVATGNSSSEGPLHAESHKLKERRDFDDGANALWSLYGKEAKTHDEARFLSLKADMDGVLLFAGLFSAVLTSFLVQSIQNLRVDPTKQSAYYQQQSVAMLAQISQQIASIAQQVPITSISPQVFTSYTVPQFSVPQFPVPPTPQQFSITPTPPPLYPAFQPSFSDIRVNIYWLIGLVCSLSAALLAILIQQWVRSYMQVFQRYDHPLKRARFRQFFFDGANGMQKSAEAVPRLIHVSLFLFFLGLGDSMINANTAVGSTTIVLICICGSFYLYSALEHLWNPQSPFQTFISRLTLIQKFRTQYLGDRFFRKPHTPTSIKTYQEQLVMEETEERKDRDVRAVRWLVDNTTVNAEMEPLVLAIPGSFNTDWGREVWIDVSSQGRSDSDISEPQTDCSPAGGQVSLTHYSLEGTAVDTICRCVRYLFETCSNHSYFPNEEARRRRMRACVEATASLVCCIDFRLDLFGEVGKLVSEIGHIERINQSPASTSDPSFVVRWTCLSLVAVQRILGSNRLQVLAAYAVSGLARFQSEYGQPDDAGWKSAQRIEQCLKTAWERVEDLHQAFEPWAQKRTREQVEEILRNHERQISELERIKVEADGMEEVDWRISLYQDAMDDATYRLTRQLPGVSFDAPHRSEPYLISDIFNLPAAGSIPVNPQLIFPGQQVQALARLGLNLREVLDGQIAEGYKDVLESLKSVDQVPISLRRPHDLMRRQLWRLQDLRDGGGLGFTIELFFLSLRQLLSIPSLHESNSVFYIGTFKVITSHWKKSGESLGTQHILLNIICDLIIPGRGVLSDFSYPQSITTMLLEMVGKMLREYAGPDGHIRSAEQEIEGVDSRSCTDVGLRSRALQLFHDPSISATVQIP